MGTNYYLAKKNPPADDLFTQTSPLHIGKRSGGWAFLLNTSVISSLEEWQKLWTSSDYVITDEYGLTIKPEDMSEIVLEGCKNGYGFIHHRTPGPREYGGTITRGIGYDMDDSPGSWC
jgi:hypothetical protein